ncbi:MULTISPECIES: amidohydrolase family protein [unclassified Blastococcus]
MTLVIRGGWVFDLSGGRRADVVVEDGVVTAVGPDAGAPYAAPGAATVLDATGRIVVPGLVNAHTHSNQTIESGLCDALPLDAWMVLASYGGAGARLGPRDLYVSTMLGCLEMLRHGTTAVLDCARVEDSLTGEGLDAVVQAYVDSGMRAAVAAQFSDLQFVSSLPTSLADPEMSLPTGVRADPDEVLSGVLEFTDRWRGRHRRIEPLLGPSSLPRCSTPLFEASVDVARQRGLRMQTHLLSAKSQAVLARERYGCSTVEFLDRIGALTDRVSFAHAIWLDDREITAFGASSAVAVHNPVSNMKLGAGRAPVDRLLRAGATVAIGADGASSNDGQDMWETLKMSVLVHRGDGDPALWPGARDALGMCWTGGAAAMGRPLGAVAPGACADLVLLRDDVLFPAPDDQLAHQLVYRGAAAAVDTVVVDGEVVVDGGRLTRVDEGALRAEARELTARLWAGLGERQARFAAVEPMLQRLEQRVRALPWPLEAV